MFDIDGTLCDIVADHADAAVSAETRRALAALAEAPGTDVALVTGRSVADAAIMVGDGRFHIHGNHGIEIRHSDGASEIAREWSAYASAIEAASRRLTQLACAYPGAVLEHKTYSLSFHFRNVDHELVPRLVARAEDIARDESLRVERGKARAQHPSADRDR